jgi:hypothetical protein
MGHGRGLGPGDPAWLFDKKCDLGPGKDEAVLTATTMSLTWASPPDHSRGLRRVIAWLIFFFKHFIPPLFAAKLGPPLFGVGTSRDFITLAT